MMNVFNMVGRRILVPCGLLIVGAVVALGCDAQAPDPVGFYDVVIVVVNNDRVPAELLVADDVLPPGQATGDTIPDVIGPSQRATVQLIVPAERDWAFYVQGAGGGLQTPAFTAADLQGCRGVLPIEVTVGIQERRVLIPNDLC